MTIQAIIRPAITIQALVIYKEARALAYATHHKQTQAHKHGAAT